MSEVKYISNRVSYCEKQEDTTIVIASSIQKSRYTLLTVWIILFGLSGLLISSQMFFPSYPGYTRIGFFAFFSFWGYFMYKISYAWLYQKKGFEFIRITDDKLYLKRAIGTHGKAYEFLLGNIKKIEPREIDKKSFSWELESSFWVIGGERLQFDYLGREIRFGIRLTDEETTKLVQYFHVILKRNKFKPV